MNIHTYTRMYICMYIYIYVCWTSPADPPAAVRAAQLLEHGLARHNNNNNNNDNNNNNNNDNNNNNNNNNKANKSV